MKLSSQRFSDIFRLLSDLENHFIKKRNNALFGNFLTILFFSDKEKDKRSYHLNCHCLNHRSLFSPATWAAQLLLSQCLPTWQSFQKGSSIWVRHFLSNDFVYFKTTTFMAPLPCGCSSWIRWLRQWQFSNMGICFIFMTFLQKRYWNAKVFGNKLLSEFFNRTS